MTTFTIGTVPGDLFSTPPSDLKRFIPVLRVQDPREPGFNRLEPFVLDSNAYVVWAHGNNFYMMRILEGFKTDAASIPRLLWPLVNPLDLGRISFLFHDWLIKRKGSVESYRWRPNNRSWHLVIGRFWNRTDVDRFFFRLMREEMAMWQLPTGNDWKSRLSRRWLVWSRKQRRRWAFRLIRSYVAAKTAAGKGEW